MTRHIQSGDTERIWTSPLHDGDPANPQTGLGTVLLSVWRASDGWWYDFNDSTFKASGHTTREQTMTQLDATNAPGVYYHDWTAPASLTDLYVAWVRDSSTTALNLPQTEEMAAGDWMDHIDKDLTAFNDLSQAQSEAACDAALATYDGPTKAELDTTESNIRGTDSDDLKDLSDQLDTLQTGVSAIDGRLPSDPADESIQLAAHAQTQADVAALENLSQAGVQAAMTAQGYTAARAAMIELSKQMLINRLELADGSSTNWILYADDDTTPLLSFNVTDKAGGAISLIAQAPARRTRGI